MTDRGEHKSLFHGDHEGIKDVTECNKKKKKEVAQIWKKRKTKI